MTSIGKCPYEFLETFTVKDLSHGRLKYSQMALEHLLRKGVDNPDVVHYAKIRIVPGGPRVAVITISLMPYGDVKYLDTVALDAPSWSGLLSTLLAYITGALGWGFGDRVARKHAASMAEWLTSVAAIHTGPEELDKAESPNGATRLEYDLSPNH